MPNKCYACTGGNMEVKLCAGWVTEGVSAFDELSGSAPVSIRQQALRGLAKIALERSDRVAAKAQYERILGKALMGRGRPAEHWAHSEYAWLVFEDGDLSVRALAWPVFLAYLQKCGLSFMGRLMQS